MTKELKICMGSACFAKGNTENLELIKKHLSEHNSDTKIKVVGMLCKNKCSDGPRIIVDETEYKNVTADILCEILKKI